MGIVFILVFSFHPQFWQSCGGIWGILMVNFLKVVVELGHTHPQFWQSFGEIGTSMPSLGYVIDDSNICQTCLKSIT